MLTTDEVAQIKKQFPYGVRFDRRKFYITDRYNKIINWILGNFGTLDNCRQYYDLAQIRFMNEDDAVLFKLRWEDEII